jgi:hypothetical protein
MFQGLLGNDTAQAHFILAYANSRFPATSVPTKQQAPSSKPNKAPASTTNYSVPQQSRSNTKPSTSQQPAAAPRHQSTAFPSQTSNAKLQIIQAPAVTIALPPSTRPSTSAFTLDHASAEAAAEAATKKLRQLELRLRAARGQSKERACFCQGRLPTRKISLLAHVLIHLPSQLKNILYHLLFRFVHDAS